MAQPRPSAGKSAGSPEEVAGAIVGSGPGAYLLLGENGLDRDDVPPLVAEKLLDPTTSAFNHDVFRADERECTAEAVSGAIAAYPAFAKVRLVVVRNIDDARDDVGIEIARAAFAGLESTVLLVLGEKLDNRRKWVNELTGASTSFAFAMPKGRAFSAWVARRAKASGIALSDAAGRLLVEYVGSDLYRAAGEIDKLALFVSPRKNVEVEDVESAVGITREDTVFQLTDAIAVPNPDGALEIARRMVGADNHPAYLIGMIVRHWHSLRIAADVLGKPRESSLGELLRENRPFLLNKYLSQARALRAERIRAGYRLALAAESAVKSGWSPPEVVLDALVCQLASPRSA